MYFSKRERMLVHLLLFHVIVFCHGKSLNYRGKRSYYNRGAQPLAQNDYYYPQIEGQPIYVPSIGHSPSDMTQLLDEYYRRHPAYVQSWAHPTLGPYNYENAGNYYESPVTSTSMVSDILGSTNKDGHRGDYHLLPAEVSMKYEPNSPDKYDNHIEDSYNNEIVKKKTGEEYESLITPKDSSKITKINKETGKTKPEVGEYDEPVVLEKVKTKKQDGNLDVPKLGDSKNEDEYEPPVVHERVKVKKQDENLDSKKDEYESPIVRERINKKKDGEKADIIKTELQKEDYEQPIIRDKVNIKKIEDNESEKDFELKEVDKESDEPPVVKESLKEEKIAAKEDKKAIKVTKTKNKKASKGKNKNKSPVKTVQKEIIKGDMDVVEDEVKETVVDKVAIKSESKKPPVKTDKVVVKSGPKKPPAKIKEKVVVKSEQKETPVKEKDEKIKSEYEFKGPDAFISSEDADRVENSASGSESEVADLVENSASGSEFEAADDPERLSEKEMQSESNFPVIGENPTNVPKFLPDDAVSRLSSLNANIWSLIFNPNAEGLKLKKCLTRTNETGFCTYVQNCEVPDIAASLEQLLNNACVIDDIFIGVCCPEFPVETVAVHWEDETSNSAKQSEADIEQTAEDCGIISNEAKKQKSWPWKAPLVSMSNGKIFCGGVIISENYVLTAAHCTTKIPKNQILVRLGQFDDETGDDFAVIEIKRHAQYNPRTLHNDIALLKLGRRIVPDDHTGVICLPDDDDDEDKHDGEKAILLGWKGMFGKDSKKTEFLEVMERDECTKKLRQNVPKTMLCTEARNEDERTCNADSGAPLVIEDDGEYEVIGILSWNRNDCDQRFPSTFSRVSRYVGWIRKHAV